MEYREVKIEVYIPIGFVEELRNGLNSIGACHIGKYDNCISVIQVSGYWRPLDGAQPYDGEVGEISYGQECQVEVRCKTEFVKDAIKMIRKIHPYEEPVYNIIPLVNDCYE